MADLKDRFVSASVDVCGRVVFPKSLRAFYRPLDHIVLEGTFRLVNIRAKS